MDHGVRSTAAATPDAKSSFLMFKGLAALSQTEFLEPGLPTNFVKAPSENLNHGESYDYPLLRHELHRECTEEKGGGVQVEAFRQDLGGARPVFTNHDLDIISSLGQLCTDRGALQSTYALVVPLGNVAHEDKGQNFTVNH